MRESSWKYLKQFSTYWADMSTWWKWLCAMFKVSDRLQTVLWCSAFIWSVAVQSKSLLSKLRYVFCTSPCQQVIGIFEFCFGKLIWIPTKYIFMEKYFIYMQIQCIPLTWSYVLKVKQKNKSCSKPCIFLLGFNMIQHATKPDKKLIKPQTYFKLIHQFTRRYSLISFI